MKRYVWAAVWSIGTMLTGWLLAQGRPAFVSKSTPLVLLTLLACTAALLWLLVGKLKSLSDDTARTRRGRFFFTIIAAAIVLFSLRALAGPPLLFALPVIGIAVCIALRCRLSRRASVYLSVLAVTAGVAGLGAGWAKFPPVTWAVLQLALVPTSLAAGWSILDHTCLRHTGIGRSLYLTDGLPAALRGFAQGALIAVPWALGLVALGGADKETWVQSWWQPLTAIQPGIAEEAWGRVLLIPLLFMLLLKTARPRTALTASVLIMAYWFAYLHTPGGSGAVFSTMIMGTLIILPLSILWLERGLETAIGFHFWLDFTKFLLAFLMNQSLTS